jgi:hypothetical protein
MTATWASPFTGVAPLPLRRVSAFLLALFVLLFATPAAAYTIEVPDFGRLESELRLKPIQKAQFDIAVQASQRALMSVAIAGLQVKERLSTELAKPLPDLNALYGLHVEAYEMAAPNFREAKNEWERVYRLLDQRQIESTKRFLRDSLGPYALGII